MVGGKPHKRLLGLLSERIDVEEVRPTSRSMNSDVTGYGWSAVQDFVYKKHGRSVLLPKRLYLSPNCNTRQPTYLPLLHLLYDDLPLPPFINCSCLQRQNRAGHSIRLVRDATLKSVTHSRLNNVAICHTDMSASLTAYVFPTLSLYLSFFFCSFSFPLFHSCHSFVIFLRFNFYFQLFSYFRLFTITSLDLILILALNVVPCAILYNITCSFFSLCFPPTSLFLRVLLINFLWF
jgi:hypothetical protein